MDSLLMGDFQVPYAAVVVEFMRVVIEIDKRALAAYTDKYVLFLRNNS